MCYLLQRAQKSKDAYVEIEFPNTILEKEEYISMNHSLYSISSNVSKIESVTSKSIQRERASPVITFLSRSVHFQDGVSTNTPTYLQKKSLYRPIRCELDNPVFKEYTVYGYEYAHELFQVHTSQIQEMQIVLTNSFQLKKYQTG
jgi:hypothetical protein